jgi:PAS domain S-box-containing protein
MEQTQLTHLLFDQSKDLIWIINLDFQLVYANKAYLTLMKEMTGVEKKLNESVFVEGFGEGYIEKWRAYYSKAIKEGYFEIEEHYYHPRTKEIQYSQIAFEPLRGDNNSILTIACQSRDITRIVKHRSVANQMMDASLDVFCTVDEHGNFIYVSAASTNHWGYLPEELIGNAYQDLILDEDVPKTNEIAAAILSGQEIKSFVNRYKKKDGGIAYNVWSARWDASAKLMYCVARDGKEQIEQEEKIQLSEQRFKALVQEGSDLIAIIDVEGNYRYVSPTCISILGISPEEFIGRNGIEFIHPEDAERALICLQKIATESRVIIEPIRFQNHKKEWRWMETVLTNMLDNPAVKGIVVNSKDITETINDRKKIEESELFNRTILESSPDCLKVLDIEGRIQYMNFNGLCQMEIDDFSGLKNKSWWSLWGSENEALVKTSVEKALEGETVQFTALCPTAKGTTKWWDVLVSPVGKPGHANDFCFKRCNRAKDQRA